jgi:predicted nucleotide-binding protein
MLEKSKTYRRVIFPPEILTEAATIVRKASSAAGKEEDSVSLEIQLANGETWKHDTVDEFFADYRKGFVSATFRKRLGGKYDFFVWVYNMDTRIDISLPTRSGVERAFGLFESNADKCRLPEPPAEKKVGPKVRVFIGHGRDPQWRDLKDHLHEKHGYDVDSYEAGARAGLTIRDVLDDMLTSSSFAVLVLTAEDLDAEGSAHARENVIHELGLFQGRLGWRKAIALLEDGVSEFSNIHGLAQIRFEKGHIQETYGEVVATIKREFPVSE